jgi:hypothetical protein
MDAADIVTAGRARSPLRRPPPKNRGGLPHVVLVGAALIAGAGARGE